MKIIHEAIVGEYHFIYSPEYLVITLDGKELVHLNKDETIDVVSWLAKEAGITFGGMYAKPEIPVVVDTSKYEIVRGPSNYPNKYPEPSSYRSGVDELATRRAVTTSPIPITDPFLAGNSPNQNSEGARILGVDTIDLARVARETNSPTR